MNCGNESGNNRQPLTSMNKLRSTIDECVYEFGI